MAIDFSALDLRALKSSDLVRLLNSSSFGEVLDDRLLRRHRTRAGYRIGNGRRIDLIKYLAWMIGERLASANRLKLLVMETEEQVALVYGVTARTIQNWVSESDWPCPQGGPYDLAVIGSWRAGHGRNGKSHVMAELERRGKTARVEREERQNAIARGDLIPREEAETIMEEWAIALRDGLADMARRLGVRLAGKARSEIQGGIDDATNELCHSLARGMTEDR